MFYIGESFIVPANASRFFSEESIAVKQPLAKVQLAYDLTNSILINAEYQSKLINYDSQYCTSVQDINGAYSSPTIKYIFKEVDLYQPNLKVIDIGCGQGEFVNELRTKKVVAYGFDPCLKENKDYLFKRYYTPEDMQADLFIMRCVLPHISDPFTFVDSIFKFNPKSSILIEFQRLEFIIQNKLWYQISHDHVNMFTIEDFLRYKVLKSGMFSNGEWGWVLIKRRDSEMKMAKKLIPELLVLEKELVKLMGIKQNFLKAISQIESPIAVWGAAGKGTVLVHAMKKARGLIHVIDVDQNKENKYMEGSGCRIISHNIAMKELDPDSLILVSNPNHLQEVTDYVLNRFEVKLPVSIGN